VIPFEFLDELFIVKTTVLGLSGDEQVMLTPCKKADINKTEDYHCRK